MSSPRGTIRESDSTRNLKDTGMIHGLLQKKLIFFSNKDFYTTKKM